MFVEVRQRLHMAVAYLSELAAWTTADGGRYHAARKLLPCTSRGWPAARGYGVLLHPLDVVGNSLFRPADTDEPLGDNDDAAGQFVEVVVLS